MHDNELEIRLLGATVVRRRNGEPVELKEWRTSKSLELVRALALSLDGTVAQDVLLDRLWPNVEPTKAAGSLRTAMYHVRKALGDDAIERRSDGLALHRAWTDVRAYALLADQVEAAHRSGHYAEVTGLCRDAEALYVHDIEVDGAGEWIGAAHQRWRQLRLRVLLAGCESAAVLGRMRESLDLAEAALELDPTSERATRATMRAFGALGETRKALAAYERLRKELADGYGVDPAPQTRALHLELLTSMSGAALEGHVGRELLIGHDLAVDTLTAVLLHMGGAAGHVAHPGVVWLVGAAGSGRFTVARAASLRAQLVLCSTTLPVDRIPGELSEPPRLSAGEVLVAPDAARVTAQDVALLEEWAVATGSLVVVPVAEMTVDARLRVLEDAQMPVAPVVQVAPLTRPEVSELLALVLQGTPAPSLVETVLSRTAGRSGEICTTVRGWLRDGRIMWTPEGMTLELEPDGGAGFPSMGSLVRSLAVLDSRAAEALAVVAFAGSVVDATDVDHALFRLHDEHPGDAQQLLDQLTDAGVLRETAGGYQLCSENDRTELSGWLRPARRRRVLDALAWLPPARLRGVVDREEAAEPAVDALMRACETGDYDRARVLLDRLSRGRSAALLAPVQALASWDFTFTTLGMFAVA